MNDRDAVIEKPHKKRVNKTNKFSQVCSECPFRNLAKNHEKRFLVMLI